jgi:hypothetical protein
MSNADKNKLKYNLRRSSKISKFHVLLAKNMMILVSGWRGWPFHSQAACMDEPAIIVEKETSPTISYPLAQVVVQEG